MEQAAARKQGYWREVEPKRAFALFAVFCGLAVISRAILGALGSGGLQPLVQQPGCPKANAALLASAIDQTTEAAGVNAAVPQRHAASLACHVRSLLYKQHAGIAVSAAEAAALHRLRNTARVPPRVTDIEWLEQLLTAVEQAGRGHEPSREHTSLLWRLVCSPVWALAWATRCIIRLLDFTLCVVTLAAAAYHWQRSMGSDSYRRRQDEAEERRFRNYSQQQGWKECPRCGHMVEKREGCNHMICRCQAHFCYSCGTDIGNLGNAYDHFGRGSCSM